MTSSSDRRGGPRQVPPPAGTESRTASAYARFIPREELRSFSAWHPDSFGSGAPAPGAAAAPAPPTPEQQRAALHAARQAGYQDGYRDGLAALEGFKQSFALQTTRQIGQLVAAFDAQFAGLEERMAEALARAATELARQVVRQELASQPELVAAVAREAVAGLLLSARQVDVRVHPDDLPLVSQGASDELERRGARLVPDPGVTRGGCLVESDVGSIDASIENRWQRAAGALGDTAPLGAADAAEPLVLRQDDVA